MASYLNGQPVRVSTTVKDPTGVLTNASTITLTVSKPDTTQQVYGSPINDSTGTYHQDIPAADLTQNGHYMYLWTTTGTVAGVSNGDFDVTDPFAVAILPLQDAKDTLNIPQTSTSNDREIQAFIDTIVSSIEMMIGGPIITRSISERVKVSGGYRTLVVRKTPLVAVTSITDVWSGLVTATTDIELDTNAGIIRRKLELPFFGWGPYYTVVYTAGLGTAVPAAIAQAARIILNHLWDTQRGPQPRNYGGGAGPEETMLPGMSYAIPNVASELLRPWAQEAYV